MLQVPIKRKGHRLRVELAIPFRHWKKKRCGASATPFFYFPFLLPRILRAAFCDALFNPLATVFRNDCPAF